MMMYLNEVTGAMETMNGFVIVASRASDTMLNRRVILGVRMIHGEREYVVATTDARDPKPRSWDNGDYHRSFSAATLAYINR